MFRTNIEVFEWFTTLFLLFLIFAFLGYMASKEKTHTPEYVSQKP